MASPEMMKEAGIGGRLNYENLGLDLPAALFWSGELPNGKFRVSLWGVNREDIKSNKIRRGASIERRFTDEERTRHFERFKSDFIKGEILPPGGAIGNSLPQKILRNEANEYGLPGDKLLLVADFTREQRSFIVNFQGRFESLVLSSADKGVTKIDIGILINGFEENCPDSQKIIFHNVNEAIFPDGVDIRDFLRYMAAQTMYNVSQSDYKKDDSTFSQMFLVNLELNRLIEKPAEYYRSKSTINRIIKAMDILLDQIMKDLSDMYPQLKK